MKAARARSRHGLNALMTRVKVRGLHAIDRRTAAARALMRWRDELIAECGGEHALTVGQRTLIEQAARTKLFLDAVDAWLVQRPTLVNGRKRAVIPALLQRQQLADALARYVTQIAEMAPAKAAGLTDPDFSFLSPGEAKIYRDLQAKVDSGEVDAVELYRQVGSIFRIEQAMLTPRRAS